MKIAIMGVGFLGRKLVEFFSKKFKVVCADINPTSNFINKISNSSMGLNLSRGKTIKYYSSDRIAQLVGNGLLTFIDEKTYLNDFFTKKEMIFYSGLGDLSEKINRYKVDKFDRKKIAKAGKKKYFRFFNSTLVANYILSKTFGFENNEKFIWDKNF